MASSRCTRLDRIAAEGLPRGIAVLTLDDPSRSANLLSTAVLAEIEGAINAVESDPPDGLVVASEKPGVFIAGADLTEFAAALDRPSEEVVASSRRGQALLGRLASLPMPTVAAIEGACLGGGAELAAWCDRRVVADTPKTRLGFPEVKLGLFPGWGGTARPPRMIGLANALELVTGGESVSAREAMQLGLADDLAPAGAALRDAAVAMVREEVASGAFRVDRQRWSEPVAMSDTELAFLGATASGLIRQKTGGHYPAPAAALELMLEASRLDLPAACRLESDRFAPLFGSPVNRALLNVFFLTDRAKKTGGEGGPQEPVRRVGVIGAGVMGRGIAAAAARRGVAVTLSDTRPDALAAGLSAVVSEAAYDRELRGPSADRAAELAGVLTGVDDPREAAAADLVVEAIVEEEAAKRGLLSTLAEHAPATTLLCTNTSTIPIDRLAAGLRRPEQFCGLHFFNPVRKMPLVEVIRGRQTGDAAVARAAAFARQLGKTPVVVGDGPGFLVNRLLMPYLAEATLLVEEGTPIPAIEKAAKRFGMPMGPLTLQDVVGLDVCLRAGRVMREALPNRTVAPRLIPALVEAGRLGQKSGAGFFDYPPAKPGTPPQGVPSDAVEQVLRRLGAGAPAEARREKGTRPAKPETVLDRLIMPMLLEATRAIEDGVVADARDVDLAMILGVGFPPFRGGLLHWADTLGASAVLERLGALAQLGERFEPTPMLKRLASSGGTFYAACR